MCDFGATVMCLRMVPRTQTLAIGSRISLRLWSLKENVVATMRRAPNPTLFPFQSDVMSSIGFVDDNVMICTTGTCGIFQHDAKMPVSVLALTLTAK